MKRIRGDSTHVESYNEGLVVFLYDEGNAERINSADPSILTGFGEDDANDPVLAELAADGVLVVFELEQDDELSIEVAVGEPLTADELAGAHWRPTQRAMLSLPTGTLCIENYNNIRIGPEIVDDEPAPRVTVPAGDYTMSLHRADTLAYEEAEEERPTAWHVITLTPDGGAGVEREGGMLLYPT